MGRSGHHPVAEGGGQQGRFLLHNPTQPQHQHQFENPQSGGGAGGITKPAVQARAKVASRVDGLMVDEYERPYNILKSLHHKKF